MKLTYLMWGYPYDKAIRQAFREEGLALETVEMTEAEARSPEAIREKLGVGTGDILFSVNFFGAVSDWCQEEGIPYCSWTLELPDFDLYTASVKNPCNYLGICDSYLVEKLWSLGVSKAFFLPEAVEPFSESEHVPVEREACFIARQPESAFNLEGMTLYGRGYLDAFLHAQRVLYGASILEEGLLLRVYQEFASLNPAPEEILPELRKLYTADRYFAPACTAAQQNIFLQNFDSIMTIYSDGAFEGCNAQKKPYVEDAEERRKIYRGKEFTLILAPHTLHNAIPRQTLEVIAAGGFPLAGFQRDYVYFFQKDETLVYFTNPAEFSRAVVRYGNSAEERERVRAAACRAVAENHTYPQRIASMLEMWERL
ncbi:MAG: glycosyltransferase [bacterium]|nr:glycosyltransferase [bacterium]